MKALRRRQSGFTLTEIIITLVVMIVLTVIAVIMMSGSIQRQNLKATVDQLADNLKQAQIEALGNNRWVGVCFKQSSGNYYSQIYYPALNASNRPTDVDCVAAETKTHKRDFRTDVTLCPTCDANVAANKSVLFNPKGVAVSSANVATNYQICVWSTKLAVGTCAREIEVNTSGRIRALNQGEAGEVAGVVANSGTCVCP